MGYLLTIENLVPIEGSSTAWAACSSPTGVLSQVFFSFIASGESSAVATINQCTILNNSISFNRLQDYSLTPLLQFYRAI